MRIFEQENILETAAQILGVSFALVIAGFMWATKRRRKCRKFWGWVLAIFLFVAFAAYFVFLSERQR